MEQINNVEYVVRSSDGGTRIFHSLTDAVDFAHENCQDGYAIDCITTVTVINHICKE